MAALLWYWREMVRFYETHSDGRTGRDAPIASGGNAAGGRQGP
jgi:hypothetical protein